MIVNIFAYVALLFFAHRFFSKEILFISRMGDDKKQHAVWGILISLAFYWIFSFLISFVFALKMAFIGIFSLSLGKEIYKGLIGCSTVIKRLEVVIVGGLFTTILISIIYIGFLLFG